VSAGRIAYYYMTRNPREMAEDVEGDEARPVYITGIASIKSGETNVTLALQGGMVTGKFTDNDAKGIARGQVSATPTGIKGIRRQLESRVTMTRSDGTYSMPCVLPGTYDFVFRDSERRSAFVMGVKISGAATVDAVIKEGVAVKGTVVDADGKPLPGAIIVMYSDNELNTHWENTGEEGEFEFEPKPPSMPYRAYAVAEGYAIETSSINLTAATNLSFRLVPAGTLEITVTRGGTPIKGETVRILDAQGKQVMREKPRETARVGYGVVMPTDDEDCTTVSNMRPGTYTVEVEGSTKTIKAEIRATETTEVVLGL